MKFYYYEKTVKIFFDDNTNMSLSRAKYGCLLELLIQQITKSQIKIRNPYKTNKDGSISMLYYNRKHDKILEFLIDYNDWLKYRTYYWTSYGQGYVASFKNGERIWLHRAVLNLGKYESADEVVDHINHNRIDNRKENLRIVNMRTNNLNKKITYSRNNSTGVAGISKCSHWKNARGNNYRVRLMMIDGSMFTKFTKTYEEAYEILKQKRKENLIDV